jgi:UDP:flavonoid glycosyltransferase YjiC (YdhE family)
MVGIPMFGDQPINIKAIADNKMGINLNYGDISKDKVLTAIRTVLDEPRYAAHCMLKLLHPQAKESCPCVYE